MTKNQKIIFLVLLSTFYFLFSGQVFAAEIFFDQEKNPGSKNQLIAHVFINTEEALNAIEGKVIFPSELLELKEIKNGNSVINVWLEQPAVGQAGEIAFSGITPGGYKGAKRLIFSMVFMVKQGGEGVFQMGNSRVLRNDGEGTEAKLKTFDLQFTAPEKEPAVEVPAVKAKDNNPPETFTPEVGRDSTVFGGKWFLVFATQDKVSGVDHYEVKESQQRFFMLFQKWVLAQSPYILTDQELRSFIFVKAVDKAGNKRIIQIAPQNPMSWYENYENWLIIIIGVFLFIIILRLWKKNTK